MAIAPQTRGFGYVIFDRPSSPRRWGVKDVSSNRNEDNMRHIAALIAWHRPAVVVVEDYAGAGSRRTRRIQELIDEIAGFASRKRIRVCRYSRDEIRETFAHVGIATKHKIAVEIARALPEFAPVLPPKRKIWLPEDSRMGIFVAAALVFSYYRFAGRRRSEA